MVGERGGGRELSPPGPEDNAPPPVRLPPPRPVPLWVSEITTGCVGIIF